METVEADVWTLLDDEWEVMGASTVSGEKTRGLGGCHLLRAESDMGGRPELAAYRREMGSTKTHQ
jgi:hypothetical protein